MVFLCDHLEKMLISEKASMLSSDANAYTFEVNSDATRTDVKNSVEAYFGVTVKQVRIINCKGKVKHSRVRKALPGTVGKKKKAIVFLKKGQHIEVK